VKGEHAAYLALHPVEFTGFHYSLPRFRAGAYVLSVALFLIAAGESGDRWLLTITAPSGARTFLLSVETGRRPRTLFQGYYFEL